MDEIDRALLAALQVCPRARVSELSRQVGLSAPATAERLRRLEDTGVVSYRAEVDPRALPIDPNEQQARYESITRAVRQAVSEHHGITLSIVSLLPLGAMPKTSSGKLRRRDCRVAILDGSLDEVARWAGT